MRAQSDKRIVWQLSLFQIAKWMHSNKSGLENTLASLHFCDCSRLNEPNVAENSHIGRSNGNIALGRTIIIIVMPNLASLASLFESARGEAPVDSGLLFQAALTWA